MSFQRRCLGTLCLSSVLLAFSSCSRKEAPAESRPEASPSVSTPEALSATEPTTLALPLGFEDANFAARWKLALSQIATSEETGFFAKTSLSIRTQPVPPEWRLATEAWLAEEGSIYRLGLSAGPSIQDARVWTRILQELQTLFENPRPQPPFRTSLRLFSAFGKSTNGTRLASLDRYLDVQPAPQASPLAREACEAFRKWFSARQLLAGRTTKAFNRNKEPVALNCSLVESEQSPPTLPFLQIAEIGLPLRQPKQRELLFKNPSDLIRAEKLQILQKMN